MTIKAAEKVGELESVQLKFEEYGGMYIMCTACNYLMHFYYIIIYSVGQD